ncbi:hypothetical protein TrCOL_g9603 [Triparma columacea]|uniref:Protein kinase domain-containing protein n=1 Tax=Triparma columacea TaxID=722753 RepID=A0A9W7L3E1_9STRA|nr:hypothetical protein TrCOL_g9603 [Triparma columacea]
MLFLSSCFSQLLLLILVLVVPQFTLSALPTGSYVHYGRVENCAGIAFGDGTDLPKGDFTVSYWMKFDGSMGRPILLDGNMRFDIFVAYPIEDRGYVNYWNFGPSEFHITPSPVFDDEVNVNTWVQHVHTYERSIDLVTYYVNGDFVANSTNGFVNETWANSNKAHDFGHFGKVSETNDKGIESWGIGCRPVPDNDYTNFRGGLDDFAVYNGVLSASEVKAVFDDVNAFDPTADNRLALYYSFNDPSSTTVLNEAPKNSGKYPLILGVNRERAVKIAEPDYSEDACDVVATIAPIFLCHEGDTCSGISSSSSPPLPAPSPPSLTCSRDSDVVFPAYVFAYDDDGQSISYRVIQLPEHGDLYEENQRWRIPESIGMSTKIEDSSLPYSQTLYLDPFFHYYHIPSDPYNLTNSDSFVVEYSDGINTVEVTIHIDIALFNKHPIISPGSSNITTFTPKEDTSITHTLAFTDYDSSLITVMVDDTPTHGIIMYDSGDETITLSKFSPFNPYGDQIPLSQYAKSVVSFSSHWFNPAEDWAASQILGEPSTSIYEDSEQAWAPATRMGTGISTKGEGDDDERESVWDPAVSLATSGFTEYIEVEFDAAVFLSDIEVGIVRGCGCVVRMVAKNSQNNNEMVIYNEKADLKCDAEDGLARLTNTINRFSPPSLCNTPFAMDRVRIEIDTTSVPDWNEIDYVKVTGYELPPAGVLPPGVTEVTYKPDTNFFGQDKFAFRSTDCGYHSDTVSELAEVIVNVEGVADDPVVRTIHVEASPENATQTIDVNAFVTNLDGKKLTVEFPILPTIGSLKVHGTMQTVTSSDMYDLDSTTFYYTVETFPEDDTDVIVKYKVHDEVQGLVSEENIKIVVQGVPINAGVPIEIIGGILGAAVFVIAVVTIYFKRIAASHQSTKKEALAMLATSRRENLELHNNLKMMKQYNDEELGMIEAQITTFRKDFNKKKTSHDGDTKNLSVGKDIEKLLILAKELESEFVIGKGSFGEVHKSKYRGAHVAVKTLHEIDRESLERFQAEILLMADLHHTNVIQLVGACWEKDLMALVMEFAEKGMSTEVLVEEGVTFTWDDPLLKWCMDTSRAMRYLHGVTYIDVKNDKLVADFGEARAFNENNTMTQVGTPLYIAPEVVKGDHYDVKADVFSYALTILAWGLKGRKLLHCLFTILQEDRGRKMTMNPKQSTARVTHAMISKGWRPGRKSLEELDIPATIVDLILQCWKEDHQKRPSFTEVLEYLEIEARAEIMPSASPGGTDTKRKTRRASTSGALRLRILAQKREEEGSKGEEELTVKIDEGARRLMELEELLTMNEEKYLDKLKGVELVERMEEDEKVEMEMESASKLLKERIEKRKEKREKLQREMQREMDGEEAKDGEEGGEGGASEPRSAIKVVPVI